jgi:CHASE2 domain-containing sensor protein
VPTARHFGGKIAPMRVFISYRRDDSMVTAALLYRELRSRPEFADAFMDIDNIGYGDDFVAAIDSGLHDAAVVVVVIGPRWTEMLQERLRGDDWVRHEVATALRLRDEAAHSGKPPIRVIPVLIGGAAPPAASALPADLAPLATLGMLKLDERALKASINSLLESIRGERFEDELGRIENQRRARFVSIAVALALSLTALFSGLDLLGLDARVATATMLLSRITGPAPEWSGEVVLVGIDEASVRAVGRAFGPSWRPEHAKLIGHAASAAARTVAFDLVLEDPAPESDDAPLQRALEATRDKMAVVFGLQHLGPDAAPAILEPFASLAGAGVACAGQALGQSYSMPFAVRRDSAPAASAASSAASVSRGGEAATREAPLLSAFALAAYSGGGRLEKIDPIRQFVLVRVGPRGQRRTEEIKFGETKALKDPQNCEVLQPGDLVARQLIDPFDLPPLRAPPQRIAYERLLNGDAAALALVKNRIVVVGAMLRGQDFHPLPWPAEDRWGVELHAAQVDAMTRHIAIRRIHPMLEWALVSGFALLGATCSHRLRQRSRLLRIAVLTAIALVWIVASIAWYRSDHQLIGVPYDIAALALGAWLANRNWRRTTA